MHFRKLLLASLATCLAIFSLTTSANASGYVTIGSRTANDGGTSLAVGTTAFTAHLETNRSYACSAHMAEIGNNLDISSVIDPSAGSVIFSEIGNVTPVMLADSSNDPDNRVSITPSGSGTQVSGAYIISVLNGGSSASVGRLDCMETTLYGGYNTNVNDFNFLEISNLTNTTITGTITAVNFDGTTVINRQAFSVSANNRADVDLHTPAGLNRFGVIRVTHNGPFGALQASVSQYSGTALSLQLSTTVPLRPRDQNL